MKSAAQAIDVKTEAAVSYLRTIQEHKK